MWGKGCHQETGQVIGDIVAVNAEVVGRITGNVMVAEMLVLKATSSLEAIYTGSTVGDRAGAVLNGKCHVAAARRWRRCLKDCYFFRF